MNSPPQQSVDHAQFSIRGDVSIHPSAVIASEVLIQAEENSRIVIGAGACIGMGTILHAYEGTLEIGERAILGAGVLILGSGQIGTEACIGAVTTIFNSSVQPQQVIPPKSLLGDPSFQPQKEQVLESSSTIEPEIEPETLTQPQKSSQTKRSTESTKIAISETSIEFESSTEITSELDIEEQNLDQISQESVNQDISETVEKPIQKPDKEPPNKPESDQQKKAQKPSEKTNQVYGQVYLNQMLIKLLPHRQSLEDPDQDSNDSE